MDERNYYYSCPLCNKITETWEATQIHVGKNYQNSNCPRRDLWLVRVRCLTRSHECWVPTRFLVSGYHCPIECTARYMEYRRQEGLVSIPSGADFFQQWDPRPLLVVFYGSIEEAENVLRMKYRAVYGDRFN